MRMASVPTFSPNPYANFDPSQWANPYTQFSGALPWPSSYAGYPTDAMGRPIQAPPGMTLNSQPVAAQPAATASNPQWSYNTRMLNAMGQALAGGHGGGLSASDIIDLRAQNNAAYGMKQPFGGPVLPPNAQPQATAAPQSSAVNPAGLSSQQYLSLLANPGNPVTPGATVPQAASSAQPNNNVLQQFLANWKPATSGPGSQFGQNFMRALSGT
jgi:hypothetical protein